MAAKLMKYFLLLFQIFLIKNAWCQSTDTLVLKPETLTFQLVCSKYSAPVNDNQLYTNLKHLGPYRSIKLVIDDCYSKYSEILDSVSHYLSSIGDEFPDIIIEDQQ